MNFFGNITQRRQRQRRHSDTNEDLNITTDLNCTTSNSLPDLSDEEHCDEITQLQNKIKELTLGLEAAHAEVESLNLENTQLKSTIDELTKKKNIYKKITTDIVSDNSTSPITNKKRRNKTNTINNSPQITPKTPKIRTNCLPTQIADKSTQYDDTHIITNLQGDKNRFLKKNKTTKKLCIISNNKRNKLSNLIEDTFYMYDYCHYLYPGGDIQQMLQGIDNKVKNFNKNDYCVIMMGELDFIRTGNYHDIIFLIREAIGKINNTNVIICLPTYRCGYYTTIYNTRIETFNNLLYLDNLTHEYAYLLDSNAELTCGYQMFSAQQGHINGTGIKNIFTNLQRTIIEIDTDNKTTTFNSSTSEIKHPDTFFL